LGKAAITAGVGLRLDRNEPIASAQLATAGVEGRSDWHDNAKL
jgi:hypothetical protein